MYTSKGSRIVQRTQVLQERREGNTDPKHPDGDGFVADRTGVMKRFMRTCQLPGMPYKFNEEVHFFQPFYQRKENRRCFYWSTTKALLRSLCGDTPLSDSLHTSPLLRSVFEHGSGFEPRIRNSTSPEDSHTPGRRHLQDGPCRAGLRALLETRNRLEHFLALSGR